MRFIWLLSILLFFLPQVAFAEIKRLAVLEFEGSGVDDARILGLLSDGVRGGLIKKIDTSQYLVMTRESTLQILKDNDKDASCMAGECEVEIGRNIGADFVISGSVTYFANTYIVTLKLHNTSSSALLSTDQLENQNPLELMKQMPSLGERLMVEGKLISSTGSSSSHSIPQEGFSGGEDNKTWSMDDSNVPVIVVFESSPSGEGTVVMVDDQMVCTKTPCSKSISSGEHKINIQKERFLPWTETVYITKGSVVKATLKGNFSQIQLQSNVEDVSFLLDNKTNLKTPSELIEVSTGEHHLVINDKCYTGDKGNEYTFLVEAAEEKKIDFPVVPRRAGVNVSVTDESGNDVAAKVFVDGEYLGDSPGKFIVGVCSKEIKAESQEKSSVEKLYLKERTESDIALKLSDGKHSSKTNSHSEEKKIPSTPTKSTSTESKSSSSKENKSSSRSVIVSEKGYDVVLIPSGSFSMGCTSGDTDCDSDEKPVHQVKITSSFYMMSTEVTQDLYQKVMGKNPSYFSQCGLDCPVDNVSWYDAALMANKLSKQEGLTPCYQFGSGSNPSVSWSNKHCNGWRLPTEAEWEYAARGKESYKYAGSNNVADVRKRSMKPSPVGQMKANGFRLYDMTGGVAEWVWDWKEAYGDSPLESPTGPASGSNRVTRGGGWRDGAQSLRVSYRNRVAPSGKNDYLGFRLVRRAN